MYNYIIMDNDEEERTAQKQNLHRKILRLRQDIDSSNLLKQQVSKDDALLIQKLAKMQKCYDVWQKRLSEINEQIISFEKGSSKPQFQFKEAIQDDMQSIQGSIQMLQKAIYNQEQLTQQLISDKYLLKIEENDSPLIQKERQNIKPKDFLVQVMQKIQKQVELSEKKNQNINQHLLMKLKAIQKYINQLKICLEVFKYESKDLLVFNFNKDRYFELMNKKFPFIQKIQELKSLKDYQKIKMIFNEQYIAIDNEMAIMQQKMSVEQILIPYKYPKELIERTHQQLVQYHLNAKLQDITSRYQKILTQKEEMQKNVLQSEEIIKKLKIQLDQKQKKLDQVKNLQILSINKKLNPKISKEQSEKILNKEINQAQYKIVVENTETIKQIFKELNNLELILRQTNILKLKRQERLKLQKELSNIRQKRKNQKTLESQLQKTYSYPKNLRDNEVNSLQKQLQELKKICQKIDQNKSKPKNPSKTSKIGISSIYG